MDGINGEVARRMIEQDGGPGQAAFWADMQHALDKLRNRHGNPHITAKTLRITAADVLFEGYKLIHGAEGERAAKEWLREAVEGIATVNIIFSDIAHETPKDRKP